ncbi:MAG: reactive intermediate/imine deaminase [Candidatus Thermofonsia Clade 1 bacterium]|jgi:2-iminobutanoate/2-iminopropanoate deaminase|uniref:Reactive intermediate/imine deaminase n=1 Tax=Candidatus Thermofonsia Clade 1 bacterium TaxID=2364210 RepID=A0A2M8PB93_9CHLR|nr:MAG: reactive intermediate/imine deaminase [Candidatus Thermofonsia Clade 1 bacterium]RMF52626.1 MAG: RidA family protein [Chloroflexota bacterium]
MNRQVVRTHKAPRAIGPYSQAIVANGFVFCSGQIALDPATGALIEGDIAAQTERAIQNLSAVLEAAGSSLAHVVKTTVFLRSMADFAAMNAVYERYFSENPPARSTVGNLELPRGALFEIEAIAALP